MHKRHLKRAGVSSGHLIGMSLITVFGIFIMMASLMKGKGAVVDEEMINLEDQPAPVKIATIQSEPIEIKDRYSGLIQPFERYNFSFQLPGKIESIGKNQKGKALDEGDVVSSGQVLASLDTQATMAEKEEATATAQFAKGELDRAIELRKANQSVVTEADLQRRKRDFHVAQSRLESVTERLSEMQLVSTVDGVISRRWVNSGESVNVQQPAFEVIQVDRVLLSVSVPESKIRRLLAREKWVASKRKEMGSVDSATNLFKAYVKMIGSPNFGVQDSEPIIGEVFRIGQTSEQDSGLFVVDVLIENRQGTLRPGLIAISDIVVNQIEGFRLPITATVVQNGKMFLYAAQEKGSEQLIARRFEIQKDNYEIQDDDVVIRDLPEEFRQVIVAGQHRLVDGRSVSKVAE